MLGANEFPLRQGFRLWRKRLRGANAPPRSAGPHPAPASFSSTQDSSEIPCLARIPALRRGSMPDEEFLRFQLRSTPLGSQLVCRPAGGIFAVAEISILTARSSSEKALRRREKPQGFFHVPDGFFFASQARPAVLGPQLGGRPGDSTFDGHGKQPMAATGQKSVRRSRLVCLALARSSRSFPFRRHEESPYIACYARAHCSAGRSCGTGGNLHANADFQAKYPSNRGAASLPLRPGRGRCIQPRGTKTRPSPRKARTKLLKMTKMRAALCFSIARSLHGVYNEKNRSAGKLTGGIYE